MSTFGAAYLAAKTLVSATLPGITLKFIDADADRTLWNNFLEATSGQMGSAPWLVLQANPYRQSDEGAMTTNNQVMTLNVWIVLPLYDVFGAVLNTIDVQNQGATYLAALVQAFRNYNGGAFTAVHNSALDFSTNNEANRIFLSQKAPLYAIFDSLDILVSDFYTP